MAAADQRTIDDLEGVARHAVSGGDLAEASKAWEEVSRLDPENEAATVNPRNNLAHCFSCGRNFNNIDLLMTQGYDFLPFSWALNPSPPTASNRPDENLLQNSQQIGKAPSKAPKSLQRQFGKKSDRNSVDNNFARRF